MGVIQPIKGNPEVKQIYLSTDFVGGVNLSYADDVVSDKDFRYLSNYDLATQGALPKRKGWGKQEVLTKIFSDSSYSDTLNFNLFVNFNDNANSVYGMLMIKDEYNIISMASNYATFDDYMQFLINYLSAYTSEPFIEFITIKRTATKTLFSYFKVIFDINNSTNPLSRTRVDFAEVTTKFKWDKALFNIAHCSNDLGIYFCDNDGKSIDDLVWFNKKTSKFMYSSGDVYKPSSLEIRKVGFNVLGTDPLKWIADSGITTESIQGVYVTSKTDIPLLHFSTNEMFKINVLYTGTKSEFNFIFTDASTIGDQTPKTFDANVVKIAEESVDGLAIYSIEFKTQPTVEVEVKISFSDASVTIQPYIDYYSLAPISPTAKKVEKLSLKNKTVISMFQRACYYGDNTLWFSEINRFDYIPNYNYVTLEIEETDYITKVVYFSQTTHIIFTSKSIWKMVGSFGSADFGLYLVSDSLGCISPNTISLVDDKLYFLSNRGLKALKNSFYRADLQNIETLDEKIDPLVDKTIRDAYSTLYQDQYILFNNFRGDSKQVFIQSTNYNVPDTIRYYYLYDSFVFTDYAKDEVNKKDLYPPFIFKNNSSLISFAIVNGEQGVYEYGSNYTDFGFNYRAIIETARLSLGYPLHIKKIKDLTFKMTGGDFPQAIYLTVYADATEVKSFKLLQTGIDENGSVFYEEVDEATFEVPSALSKYGKAEIGKAKMGYNPIFLTKQRVGQKCKNISMKIECESSESLSLLSLGYTFILRKIK